MQFRCSDRVGVRRDDEGMVDSGSVQDAEADLFDFVMRRDEAVDRAGELTVGPKQYDPSEGTLVILIQMRQEAVHDQLHIFRLCPQPGRCNDHIPKRREVRAFDEHEQGRISVRSRQVFFCIPILFSKSYYINTFRSHLAASIM